MSESFKKFRAHFPKKGAQREWISEIRDTLSVSEIASLCSCSERTVRDWQRERFHMDYACLEKICAQLQLPLPPVKKTPTYAHTKAAGLKGGKALIEKYGKVPVDESARKERWQAWWKNTGNKQSVITQPKKIIIPRRSADLAEFVGIVMGDGGISNYQLTITLHSVDDKAYGVFVTDLIQKLFGVRASVRPRKNMQATDYVVSRKALVDLCSEKLGLNIGNKLSRPLSIPEWIKSDQSYSRACVRGLVDTDGSVFTHKYKVGGKEYRYKKMAFTSACPGLREEVGNILSSEGISSSIRVCDVRIESVDGVKRYFSRIGSHNPKHLKRWTK